MSNKGSGNFTKVPNELYQLYTRLPGFNGNHVLMYVILTSYRNDKYGYAFPDQDEIAALMNCHPNTVGRIGAKLREIGLVEYRRRYAGGNYVYYVKEPIKDRRLFFEMFPEAKRDVGD